MKQKDQPLIGMILKGYPRISESFISAEILLLESLGVPLEIYSLRQPRENFTHDYVSRIKAPVTYLPEYVLPNIKALFRSNWKLWRRLRRHYVRCLIDAVGRAWERKRSATLRHFLQAGHLSATRLLDRPVVHLHAHFCHTPTSVAFFASKLSGIPFSFTGHAKDIYTSEPEQIRRKMESARFVITCTKHNADYLSSICNGCVSPPVTIYHGIDLDFFSFGRTPAPTPPYRILSIGRMVPKKGYDVLIAALKLLDDTGVDFQWIQIGSGEMESQIRSLVYKYHLEHRVSLLGTLPREQVIDHYRTAHCFALACKVASNGDRDGIPNVLVEAMAVGIPVVSTNVSAIPELVEDGITGTVVESEDSVVLARAILKILQFPDDYKCCVGRARAKVEEEFDNRGNVRRLAQIFRRVLSDR